MAERPRKSIQYQRLTQNPTPPTQFKERVQVDKFYQYPQNPTLRVVMATAVIVATTLAWNPTTANNNDTKNFKERVQVDKFSPIYPSTTSSLKSTPYYYPFLFWNTSTSRERVQLDKFAPQIPDRTSSLRSTPQHYPYIFRPDTASFAAEVITPDKWIGQYPDSTRSQRLNTSHYPYISWNTSTSPETPQIDKWLGQYPDYIIRTPKRVIAFNSSFQGGAENTSIDKWFSESLSLMPNRRPPTNVYFHEHNFWNTSTLPETVNVDKWFNESILFNPNTRYSRIHLEPATFWTNFEIIRADKWIGNYPDIIPRRQPVALAFNSSFTVSSTFAETIYADKWQPILPFNIGYRPPIIVATNDSFGIPITPIDWYFEWQYYSNFNPSRNIYWTQQSYFAPSRVIPTVVPSFGWFSEHQLYIPMNRQTNFYWIQTSYFSPSKVIPAPVGGTIPRRLLLGVGL